MCFSIGHPNLIYRLSYFSKVAIYNPPYLNMTSTQIGRRERGEIPLRSDEISQLLNLFHCSYEDLIGGDSNAH